MNEEHKDWLACCTIDELKQWEQYISKLLVIRTERERLDKVIKKTKS